MGLKTVIDNIFCTCAIAAFEETDKPQRAVKALNRLYRYRRWAALLARVLLDKKVQTAYCRRSKTKTATAVLESVFEKNPMSIAHLFAEYVDDSSYKYHDISWVTYEDIHRELEEAINSGSSVRPIFEKITAKTLQEMLQDLLEKKLFDQGAFLYLGRALSKYD